jgi:hypothetical protein
VQSLAFGSLAPIPLSAAPTSLRFEPKGKYMHEGALYWFWIGAHDEYQRVLKK